MEPAIPHETPPTGAAIESLVDGAGIGYAWVSLEGRILAANDALHHMLGRHRPSLRNCQLSVLGNLADGEPLQGRFDAYRNGLSDLRRTLFRLATTDGASSLATITIQNATASGGFPDGHELLVIDAAGTQPLAAEAMQAEFVTRDHPALVTREASYFAHQVFHDPLTELANRRLLINRLRQALDRARPTRDAVAVAMLDLDGFKPINDSLGYTAGDELLREVARRLQACVRGIDTVARWGGDEFMFVLPLVMDEEGARSAAARMLGALTPPITVRDQRVRLRASVGIALFPQHASDADELLVRADAAMFAAKRDGGGIRVFCPRRSAWIHVHQSERSEVRAESRPQSHSGSRRSLSQSPRASVRPGQDRTLAARRLFLAIPQGGARPAVYELGSASHELRVDSGRLGDSWQGFAGR